MDVFHLTWFINTLGKIYTAVAKKIYTPALWKWGHFDRAKPILKILVVLQIDTMYVEEV